MKLKRIFHSFLKILVKYCIKNKIFFSKLFKTNKDNVLFYVFPFYSEIDLLILQKVCKKYNLPDPYHKIIINKKEINRCIFINNQKETSSNEIEKYFLFLKNFTKIKLQLIFVYIMIGRFSNQYKIKDKSFFLLILQKIKKFFTIIIWGRETFTFISEKISIDLLVRKNKFSNVLEKICKYGKAYFKKRDIITIGPNILNKKKFSLLKNNIIKKAIQEEAFSKKISYKQAKKNAKKIIKEISSNFSYFTVRIINCFMKYLFKRLYKNIYIKGKKKLHKIINDGNQIIYLPCHRSHIDYLLLSYVLYHQGLIPPHIVAGINLNIWPIGFIFRNLGAFFIRRTFQKNKLYSIILREYLIQLFTHGYPVEYFIEGGRSRTGFLLNPKTGILSMTFQSIFRKKIPTIFLYPVYIGYEYVIETESYSKELLNINKKENFFLVLYKIWSLKNLGKVSVNFGKPFCLNKYLYKYHPKSKKMNFSQSFRPISLIPILNKISKKIMIRINNACTVNSINLCVTVLLSSENYILSRKIFIEQIKFYLKILKNIPYLKNFSLKSEKANKILLYTLSTKKIITQKNNLNKDIIFISKNVLEMYYYRNNIYHILVIPELVSIIIYEYKNISWKLFLKQINLLYPILKDQFFLKWKKNKLPFILKKMINEFSRQKILYIIENKIQINKSHLNQLKLLKSGIYAILLKYSIIFCIVYKYPNINQYNMKRVAFFVLQELKEKNLEFYTIKISSLILILRNTGYLNFKENSIIKNKKIKYIYFLLKKLIQKKTFLKIKKLILSLKISC